MNIAIRKNVSNDNDVKETKILNRLSEGYRAIKPSHINEGFQPNFISSVWEYIINNEMNGRFVVCLEATHDMDRKPTDQSLLLYVYSHKNDFKPKMIFVKNAKASNSQVKFNTLINDLLS